MTSPADPPRVLILASAQTYRLEPFLEAARKLGVTVVRGLDVPPAHTHTRGDVLGFDFHDIQHSVAQAQAYGLQKRLRAVIPTDDGSTLLAAHLSEELDLPHNSVAAAEAARNKYTMRTLFAQAGVPSPWFKLFTTDIDPAQVAAQVTYPCVLKPTCLAGSCGVIRANDSAEFVTAWARVKKILTQRGLSELLVEGYLPGQEVALEGLLHQGRLQVLALFDKPDPLEGPFFEETIYVTPSRWPAETQRQIGEVVAQAAEALGLREGPVHAEARINPAGVWMLEIAGRSIGGLCSKTLRFGTALSLEELILRQAVGLDVEAVLREGRAGGVMMIPIPGAGILTGVSGLAEAGQIPGIESIEITARINYPLWPLPEGDSYLGFIFARGEQPEAVEAALRAAYRCLRFEIAPELPVTNYPGQ